MGLPRRGSWSGKGQVQGLEYGYILSSSFILGLTVVYLIKGETEARQGFSLHPRVSLCSRKVAGKEREGRETENSEGSGEASGWAFGPESRAYFL